MIRILQGDCREVLTTLPNASMQCCVTSPPYFSLRDYGVSGQIGLEASPDEFVAEMVSVFREVRRVLRGDGILFLNLGDSYFHSNPSGPQGKNGQRAGRTFTAEGVGAQHAAAYDKRGKLLEGSPKPKDLLGIPWMVAFALRADGWYLRSDIIWSKPNPMPESVIDRPTSAHEHVFLLSKSARYFYDAEAIREEATGRTETVKFSKSADLNGKAHSEGYQSDGLRGANRKNVWTIATQPFGEAHFATFPPELAERCIKAGSKPGDMILDPFAGAFTTAMVADRLQRDAIGIELSPEYCAMAERRLHKDAGLFAEVTHDSPSA